MLLPDSSPFWIAGRPSTVFEGVGSGSPALELASDVRGQRQVRAVMGEVVAPLTPDLTLNLAARQEHASDSGRVRSLGAGLRWRALRSLLLRLSASRDFRAATLYELHAPSRLEQTGSDHDDPLPCPGGVAADGVADTLVCARTFWQRSSTRRTPSMPRA